MRDWFSFRWLRIASEGEVFGRMVFSALLVVFGMMLLMVAMLFEFQLVFILATSLVVLGACLFLLVLLFGALPEPEMRVKTIYLLAEGGLPRSLEGFPVAHLRQVFTSTKVCGDQVLLYLLVEDGRKGDYDKAGISITIRKIVTVPFAILLRVRKIRITTLRVTFQGDAEMDLEFLDGDGDVVYQCPVPDEE